MSTNCNTQMKTNAKRTKDTLCLSWSCGIMLLSGVIAPHPIPTQKPRNPKTQEKNQVEMRHSTIHSLQTAKDRCILSWWVKAFQYGFFYHFGRPSAGDISCLSLGRQQSHELTRFTASLALHSGSNFHQNSEKLIFLMVECFRQQTSASGRCARNPNQYPGFELQKMSQNKPQITQLTSPKTMTFPITPASSILVCK